MDYSASAGIPAYTLNTIADCGPVMIDFFASIDGGAPSTIPQDNASQAIVLDSARETL